MPAKLKSLKDSKLIKLLATLDGAEWKRFNLFMRSPYFYKNKHTSHLFEILSPLHPSFPESDLDQLDIFQQLYGDIPYHPTNLRLACSDLFQCIVTFKTYEGFQEDSFAQMRFRYLGIEGLKMKRSTEIKEKAISRLRDKMPLPGQGSTYAQLHLFFLEDYNFSLDRASILDLKRIEAPLKALDSFYLPEKLKFFCVTMQELLKRPLDNYNLDWLENTVKQYENYVFPSSLSAIYYHLFASMWYLFIGDNEASTANFDQSTRYRKELLGEFSPDSHKQKHPLFEELHGIFDCSVTICNQKYRKGELAFYKKLYQLYKGWLQNGLLNEGDMLRHNHLKNVITLSLRAGDIEFVNLVLASYPPERIISNKEKEIAPTSAFAYNQAHVYLYEKNFRQMKQKLAMLIDKEKLYKRATYIMRLEATLDEFIHNRAPDLLDDYGRYAKNYKAYLIKCKKGKEISVKLYKEQILFIETISTIFNAYYEQKRLPLTMLEEVQMSSMGEKIWLIEKIKPLM